LQMLRQPQGLLPLHMVPPPSCTAAPPHARQASRSGRAMSTLLSAQCSVGTGNAPGLADEQSQLQRACCALLRSDDDDGGFRICHSQTYTRPATQLVPEEEESVHPSMWEPILSLSHSQAPHSTQMPHPASTTTRQLPADAVPPLSTFLLPIAQVCDGEEVSSAVLHVHL
jgi:hypothetical protein